MNTVCCRFCRAQVLWCVLPSGKRIPLDPQAGWAGRYLISQGQDGTWFAKTAPKGEKNNGDRRRAHFSSCSARRKVNA